MLSLDRSAGASEQRPTPISSRWRKAAVAAFCLAAFAGCSSAVDDRQLTTSSRPGIIFFGEVRTVYIARSDLGGGNVVYANVPGAYFDYLAERRPGAGGFPSETADTERVARYRALSVLFGAIGLDVETALTNQRCVYVVRTEDGDVTRSVRRRVLDVYDDEDRRTPDYYGLGGPFAYPGGYPGDVDAIGEDDPFAPPGAVGFPAPPPAPAVPERDDGDALRRQHLTLAQTCNERLAVGTRVVVSLTEDGATIHPTTAELSEVDGAATGAEGDVDATPNSLRASDDGV